MFITSCCQVILPSWEGKKQKSYVVLYEVKRLFFEWFNKYVFHIVRWWRMVILQQWLSSSHDDCMVLSIWYLRLFILIYCYVYILRISLTWFPFKVFSSFYLFHLCQFILLQSVLENRYAIWKFVCDCQSIIKLNSLEVWSSQRVFEILLLSFDFWMLRWMLVLQKISIGNCAVDVERQNLRVEIMWEVMINVHFYVLTCIYRWYLKRL